MKLLLTSEGIRNKKIIDALLELLGKDLAEAKVAYIPTASSVNPRKKNWMIDDMKRYADLCPYVDIVDIAAAPRKNWEQRLKDSDVLVFGGGNPFYLRCQLEKSGLSQLLGTAFKNKVIVGVSAGSMIMGKTIALEPTEESKEYLLDNAQAGLGFVDFNVIPHLGGVGGKDTPVDKIFLEETANRFPGTLYGLDDETAIVIKDNEVAVVSEGKWQEIKVK